MTAEKQLLARAWYSNVERRLWVDVRFREELSQIPPCGAGLWLYLLTTPKLGVLPGLIVMGEAAMAEELKWPLKGFRKAFEEVVAAGMAEADWRRSLVITPKVIGRNPPNSPNVIKSWRQQWMQVPESHLKVSYYEHLSRFVESLGEGFQKAFAKAIEDPSSKDSPNQKQQQEQKQKQEQQQSAPEGAPAAAAEPARPFTVGLSEFAEAIEATILKHGIFDPLDAREIAKHHAGLSMTGGPRLEWILAAIDQCADKASGASLTREALASKLGGFIRHARDPRPSGVVPAQPRAAAGEFDWRQTDQAKRNLGGA